MKELLPYITAIIAIAGFVFSVWKYIDLKNREEKRLNYENFTDVIRNLRGEYTSDMTKHYLEGSFYVANVYKLLEFPEYKYISIPVLKLKKDIPPVDNPNDLKHIPPAIDEVLSKLEQL